jgi:transcription elongation factor Elf1
MPETKTMTPPVCESCGQSTRLIGLERHGVDAEMDVLTFHCDRCGDYAAVEARTRGYLAPIPAE